MADLRVGSFPFNDRKELNSLVKPSAVAILLAISLPSLFSLNGQPKILERPPNQTLAEGWILSSPTRHYLDLTGQWSYSFDGETWGGVSVPSSFAHEGKIIFQRKFTIDRESLESSHFKFVGLGINNEAEILINDVFVGKHYGGSTGFDVDIPDGVLQFGTENTIRVIANNVLTASTSVPVRKQLWGWRTYGGILRETFLLVTPRVWVNRLALQAKYFPEKRQGEIHCGVTISNVGGAEWLDTLSGVQAPPSLAIQFELMDAQTGEIVGFTQPQQFELRINQDTELHSILAVNSPKSWSPESPERYRLKASLLLIAGKKRTLVDEVSQPVGFRSVELVGDKIHLNGKRLTLKGIIWHEDSPQTGASLSYEEMERDVVLMKTLGANVIRFAFHPPHPYMIELCSRYGILATEEVPVWSVPASVLAQEQFQDVAEALVREMVARDQHHPSVLAWGLGGEFDSSDPRARSYVQRLTNALKSLDDRPVFFGSVMLRAERCADLVDFVAMVPSETDLKAFKLSLAMWKQQYPRMPLVVFRYGKPVEHDNRNGYSDPLSQEAQARFFIHHYEAIRQAGAAGSFINAFADWTGDRPLLSLHTAQPNVYPLGLVSAAREKRLAFEVVKTLYADQKVGALPAGNHRSSLPVAHVIAGFSIIFVLAYQYNYNRRFREAVKRSLLRPYNFFADLRDLRATTFLHTLILALAISLTLAVVVSGFLYFLRGNFFGDSVMTHLIPSDALKAQMAFVAWNLTEGIAILTGIFFALAFVVAVAIKIASLATRARVTLTHALSVTTWSATPLVFLSPLGMSLFKVLENPIYLTLSLIVVGLFVVWVVVRMLRGISVLFDVSAGKTYAVGFLLIVLVKLSIFFYLDSQFLLSDYITFVMNVARYSL